MKAPDLNTKDSLDPGGGKLARIEHLVEAIPAYLYAVRLEGGIAVATEHGRGCIAVTGYSPEDYTEDPDLWISMVHPDDREKVTRHLEREIGDENPGPLEHRIVHRDGSTRWIRNTIVHRHAGKGEIVGYDGLIEDITERKTTRLALEKAREELERRVEERTSQLTQANEELRKAMAKLEQHGRERIQFVSNVSHDLKTPVMAMGFTVENLLRGFKGRLPEKAEAYLLRMKEDIARLGRTLNDILDVTKIDEKRLVLNRVPVPLMTFIQRATDSMRGYAEEKGVYLVVKDGKEAGFIECDPSRSERAVINVIHNAIKFTPGGGTVEVHHGYDSGRRAFLLSITDSGIGIPADLLPQVGTRYFRVAEGIPGSGLGLSSARQILELQGGFIDIQSPPNGCSVGTRVELGFRPAHRPRALLADSSEASLSLMQQQLRAHEYETVAASSAARILELLEQEQVAVIVADLNMPDMDVSDLVSAIKANGQWRRIPVLALVSEVYDGARNEILKKFEIPILMRPWKEEELVGRVYDMLVGRYMIS